MSKKLKYISVPIYSIATFNEFYFISGGGGGKTGIKNQILVYRHKIQNAEPVYRIQTGDKIVENMYICPQKKILIASANQKIKIFHLILKEANLQLIEKQSFIADHAQKNSTIYSLCYQTKRNLLCTAGEDLVIRFFTLDKNENSLKFQHSLHSNPLKNVDHNDKNLFLSCDTNEIVLIDVDTNKIVRKIFNDQLQPQKSMFQSAYFNEFENGQLLICHYILRKAAYVTRQQRGRFETAQITKDQSCLTSYSKPLKLLGIACGNGTTYLVKSTNLSIVSKEQNHAFVITGGTVSRGGRFVTGNFLNKVRDSIMLLQHPAIRGIYFGMQLSTFHFNCDKFTDNIFGRLANILLRKQVDGALSQQGRCWGWENIYLQVDDIVIKVQKMSK